MRRRPVVTILMLIVAVILALPMRAQQKPVAPGFSPAKPFTQDQVQGLVRDGLGDESGAKLIEQRGIDFAPAEDFLQTLKAAGASEAFLDALRAAKPPEPASAKKPLNQVQVFALLAGQVSRAGAGGRLLTSPIWSHFRQGFVEGELSCSVGFYKPTGMSREF